MDEPERERVGTGVEEPARPSGGIVDTGRAVIAHARAADVPTLSAAVAYYAFVSVLPLVVVTFTMASVVAGEAVAARIVAATSGLLTEGGRDVVDRALTQGDGRGGATVIGVVLLTWSGLRLFRGLDTAFSRVYATTDRKPLLASLRDAVTVFAASVLAVGVNVALGSVVGLLSGPLADVGGPLVLVVGLTVVFLPVFYVFPDRGVTVREVLPGAVVAAVGWALLNVGFVAYAAVASASAYGLLGTVLLFVTWFYFAALIVLFAVSLNVVLAADSPA